MSLDPTWTARVRYAVFGLFALVLVMVWQQAGPLLKAQDAAGPRPVDPSSLPMESAADPSADVVFAVESDQAAARPTPQREDVITLFFRGGFWMYPILLMSALSITFTIERFLGLRTARVLPQELIEALGRLANGAGGFDPREAYRICQRHPSTTASIVQDMLLKVGRPHSEVEHTVAGSTQREAEKLYANVRWLNLAAAVAPLIGLLGTAWGMIECFQTLKLLGPSENKIIALSDGIYVALMTTVFGLVVAIPSSIFAHVFEGWIQQYMHSISELVDDLMPQIERYEGRVRFGRFSGEDDGGEEKVPTSPARPDERKAATPAVAAPAAK